MFEGADDGGLIPGLQARRRLQESRWRHRAWGALLAFLALWLALSLARAEVQGDPRPIVWKRCSTTITAGGTAQNLALGNGPLRGFLLQNPVAATESLFFDPAAAASTTSGISGELAAGATLATGPGTIFFGNTISVNAVTTAHALVCFYGQ